MSAPKDELLKAVEFNTSPVRFFRLFRMGTTNGGKLSGQRDDFCQGGGKKKGIMNARAWKVLVSTNLLPLLLLLALPAVAQAQNYFTNGLDIWAYTPSTGPVNIYGYSGPGGALVIPNTIHGSPVTSIGGGAFFGNSSLTSVGIPDTVTSIGVAAFDGCTSLNSITIPGGVTSIGTDAFAYCSGLTGIAIPDSVTSLGDGAFYDCTGLTGVTIGNSVSSLGEEAFYNCINLTTINIPNSVASIEDDAFAQCSSLTGVTIGNGVTSIGDEAFGFCSSLTGLTIGNNVTSIGDSAFFDCTSLTSVTIPDSATGIGDFAFWGCGSLTGVIIGNSVTSIGEYAFGECFSLSDVTLGSSVADIGFSAFYICDSLRNITFPDSVTNIEEQAFAYCNTLTNVTIPAGVVDIGDGAFFDCSGLTAIDVDAANANYSSVNGILFDKTRDTLIQYPGSKNGDYIVPSSVTRIETEAFYNCFLLTTVIIPNSVTSIGDYAFTYCDSLTTVTIGRGVTSLENDTFSQCYNLTGVYFLGNSPTPTNDLTVFQDDTEGVVYYLPSTTGWGTLFDGLPTMSNVLSSVVGNVDQIVGHVTVTHPDGSTATLQSGDPLQMGDIVTTPAGGMAHIQFIDNTSLKIAENAKLSIDEYVFDPKSNMGDSTFSVLRGVFVYTSGLIGHNDADAEHLHIGYGELGIRGTEFIVQQDPCSSTQMVYLIHGELAITPLNTPGVTNICDAPVTISVTTTSVATSALDQATYDSISNQVFQSTGIVTFPSWLEQYFDCTNNPDAASNADPDGDGQSNYSEFLAGTDPATNSSSFHILSATPRDNDLFVTWLCGGGRTNVLQATTNLGGSWFNISPNIVLPGSGDNVTNYLDVGAVTNTPTRFYRVLLVQ